MSKYDLTPEEAAREAKEALVRALRNSSVFVDEIADWAKDWTPGEEARMFYLKRAAAMRERAHRIEYRLKQG